MRFVYSNRLAGNGGTHLDLRSGSLSWSEHRALLDTAASAAETAISLERTSAAIKQLNYEVKAVASGVDRMERNLTLRLDTQTALLKTEVELLANIAQSLRTPGATRAAERIADAGALLEDGRYERALAAARQAIDDDPKNRGGFIAAGWSLLGLERPSEARDYFREAAQCGRGDGAHSALRQAARLTFLLDGGEDALRELGTGFSMHVSSAESAAANFDRVVYNTSVDKPNDAINSLQAASQEARGFCLMAMTDPVIALDARVVDATVDILRELDSQCRQVKEAFDPHRQRLSGLFELLNSWKEWDESQSIVEDVRHSLNAIDGYLSIEVGELGFDGLKTGLTDLLANALPSQHVAEIAEKYIHSQRQDLEKLRLRVERGREVPLDTPRKRDGSWQVLTIYRGRELLWTVSFVWLFRRAVNVEQGQIVPEVTGREIAELLRKSDPAFYAEWTPKQLERELKRELLTLMSARKAAPVPWPYSGA